MNDMSTKIIVCGGRRYGKRERLYQELDRLDAEHDITILVHGAATGADTLAGDWAKSRGKVIKAYPADWDTHGRAAGPIRNALMLQQNKDAKYLIAFPGGRGTEDMIRKARAEGMEVVQISEDR